jgi:hypothetical protein
MQPVTRLHPRLSPRSAQAQPIQPIRWWWQRKDNPRHSSLGMARSGGACRRWQRSEKAAIGQDGTSCYSPRRGPPLVRWSIRNDREVAAQAYVSVVEK